MIARRRRQMRRLLLLRILTIALIITVAQAVLPYTIPRELAYLDPDFGRKYILELINSDGGSNSRIFKTLRMPRLTFLTLVAWLKRHTSIKDSRKGILLEEKLGIYLYVVGQGASLRLTSETFRRSTETVSRAFHEILKTMNDLYLHEVKLPTIDTPIPHHIRKSRKFWPHFKDCIGALDGSHVNAHVPTNRQGPYRNRKGQLTQNVLAVCNFNMLFTYILAGWEGTANDARVLQDAQFRGFEALPGQYYLADAGYPNSALTITSYRGVRYHLKEQARSRLKPQNKEELFNLRHASLRNVIERQFGVLKRRFKIIRTAPEFPLPIQTRLIYALTDLNNFITRNSVVLDPYQVDLDSEELIQDPILDTLPFEPDSPVMNGIREAIASQMWFDYCNYTARLRGGV